MVGLMWPKETGAKENIEAVQNKCVLQAAAELLRYAIHGLALRARVKDTG
jgi:hypothetical protein